MNNDQSESSASPVLAALGVSKYYGRVTGLENANFGVSSGEVHAIVGDNGAGKSTLVKILSGAIPPSRIPIVGPVRGCACRNLTTDVPTLLSQLLQHPTKHRL